MIKGSAFSTKVHNLLQKINEEEMAKHVELLGASKSKAL